MSPFDRARMRGTGCRDRAWIPVILGVGALGVLAHLVLFVFVAVPLGEGPAPPSERPFAGYYRKTGEDQQLLQEQSVLLDSKPLFMPTPWNVASSLQDIARLRDEAELFARYEPVVRLQREGWAPRLADLPLAATSIEARLRDDPVYPLNLFGQRENPAEQVPLAERQAAVSIENLGGGPAPAGFSLSAVPGEGPPERLWSPAVFLVAIDPRSKGGAPLREAGSGDADWDAALARYLGSESFRQRLAPGYYRITVGP